MAFVKQKTLQKKKLRITITNDELNTKSSRSVYVKNNIMTNIIKHCRGFQIPDFEITVQT